MYKNAFMNKKVVYRDCTTIRGWNEVKTVIDDCKMKIEPDYIRSMCRNIICLVVAYCVAIIPFFKRLQSGEEWVSRIAFVGIPFLSVGVLLIAGRQKYKNRFFREVNRILRQEHPETEMVITIRNLISICRKTPLVFDEIHENKIVVRMKGKSRSTEIPVKTVVEESGKEDVIEVMFFDNYIKIILPKKEGVCCVYE